MAKDPKNFTGEDVPLLLRRGDDRRREIEDWRGMATGIAFFIGLLLLLYILGSWVVELFR